MVLWQPGLDPAAVAGLAGTRTYPLNSSFQPSYNMAVNLVGQVGRARGGPAGVVVRPVPGRPRGGRPGPPGGQDTGRDRGARGGLRARRPDELRRAAPPAAATARATRPGSSAAARRREALASLERLRPGDIIQVPSGRRAGIAVVLQPPAADGQPMPLVLTDRDPPGQAAVPGRLPGAGECHRADQDPGLVQPEVANGRRDLAATVRNKLAGRDLRSRTVRRSADGAGGPAGTIALRVAALRRELRRAPLPRLPGPRAAPAPPARRPGSSARPRTLEHRVSSRSHVLARTFGRVCAVLEELGYVDGRCRDPSRAGGWPPLHRARPARR